jgi:hypothetical protein
MFEMRPAVASDQESIAEMVQVRMGWMRENGIPDWPRTDEDVNAIASQAAADQPVWVLVSSSGQVVGCTSVYEKTPEWGWTEEELAQSAYFLATSFTHPAYRNEKPGHLMAVWALNRAALNGFEWVRRGTFAQRLMVYYRDAQGWTLVHTPERKGHTAYLMARRAELMPEVTAFIKDSVTSTGDGHTSS